MQDRTPSSFTVKGLIVLCLFVPGLAAQTVRWGIPERGVAFYRRDLSITPGNAIQRIQNLSAGGRDTPGFQRVLMPAVLLEGDLDARRQHIKLPPDDLRELATYLAFDLRHTRSKGSFRRVIPFLMGIGAVHIKGKWGTPDDDGVQTIKATLSREQTEQGKIPKRVYQNHYGNWQQLGLDGDITITRKVDREKGLVTWFDSKFNGKFSIRADAEPPPGSAAARRRRGGDGARRGGAISFTIENAWVLDSVKENRYPGFRARVAEAIKAGADYIKEAIRDPNAGQFRASNRDGRVIANGRQRSYNSGRLALCLLTLVKADVDRKDPVVQDGYRELRRRILVDTYALGLALMAMEALYAPSHERQALIEGRMKAPGKRNIPPEDLKLMQGWTDKLLKNTDACRDVQRGYLLRFNYVPNMERYDNSNTQYALLGLYSAYLAGVKISPTRWYANAQHWLKDQGQDEQASVPLRLVTHRQYSRFAVAQEASSTRTVTGGNKVPIAGWPYVNVRPVKQDVKRAPRRQGQRGSALTGSMTTAGVTGISICEAVLYREKKGMELTSKLRDAKRHGFAWLLHNFSVRSNKNHRGHYYYYMYGLERACELSQVRLLGNHDWYFEGATMLLELQTGGARPVADGDGPRGGRGRGGGGGQFRNGGLHDTCFAILFLKLASPPLPVITPR